MSWSTSEQKVRLAPRKFLCLVFLMPHVHCCLVVTYWEIAELLALVGGVYCIFVTFPGVSGVVLDCIVS